MAKRGLNNESNSLISDNRPSFFKVIFAGHANDHMRIPPHFMRYISDEVTHSAILKAPSGCHWHINLQQTVNGVYLQNGWKEFLIDNSLGDNEFLVFRYDGNTCFDVKIFDKSGCERVNASVNRTNQESAPVTEKRKRGRPRKHPVAALHPHKLKYCQNSPDQHLQCCKSNKFECFNGKDIQSKIKTEMMETDSQPKKVEEKNPQKRIKSAGKELCGQEINLHTSHHFSRRKPPTEEGNNPQKGIKSAGKELCGQEINLHTSHHFSRREPPAEEGNNPQKRIKSAGKELYGQEINLHTSHHFSEGGNNPQKRIKSAGKELCGQEINLHTSHHFSRREPPAEEGNNPPKRIKSAGKELCGQEINLLTSHQFSRRETPTEEGNNPQERIKSAGKELCGQEINLHTSHHFSRREPPTEEGKAGIWKTSECFTSKFPYFKRCLKSYSVNKVFIMPIPKSFSEMYFPPSKSKIVLRNSEGKRWVVNMVPTVAGNCHTFCGGWVAFARENQLKQGDCCIFELVHKNEMQVHIFRSAEKV